MTTKQKIISKALGKTASDVDWEFDLERRPLDQREHPGVPAIMLVREALSQFEIPSRVEVAYKGMNRVSGHGQHHLTDGLINVQATFNSLSGHKHVIDVPVIVHGGYMVFPEVFVHQGATEVMAQSAFDELLRRGDVHTKVQDRKNMFSPHVEPNPRDYVPAVGTGLFNPTAQAHGFKGQGKEDLENIKEGQVYEVYGNRRVGTFSLKNASTGRVEGYSRGPFSLLNARFHRNAKTRDRIRQKYEESGKTEREVHAWVVGEFSRDTSPISGSGSAYYNPLKVDDWIDFNTSQVITDAVTPRALMYFGPGGFPVTQYEDPETGAVEEAFVDSTSMPKQADHAPQGLDPAERPYGDDYMPGDTPALANEVQVRIRGGSRLVYPKGTKVTVIRDMHGDGYVYYCEFPDRRRAPVHYADLK